MKPLQACDAAKLQRSLLSCLKIKFAVPFVFPSSELVNQGIGHNSTLLLVTDAPSLIFVSSGQQLSLIPFSRTVH
jgi:hypothetical protein